MTEAPLDAAPAPPPAPAAPVADAAPRPLDPRIVRVWRLAGLVTTAILAAPTVVLALIFGVALLAVPAAIVVAGLAWVVIVPRRRYERWRFRVGETDVRVERGVWWRQVTVVLHARIQHVDTKQGPLERMLGLGTVHIFTAGTVGALVEIPGLAHADAEALRDRLAALSGSDDAV